MNEDQKQTDRKKLSLAIGGSIGIAALLVGSIIGSMIRSYPPQNFQMSASPVPAADPLPSPESAAAPSPVFTAKDTCGDPPDPNATAWYPVFIDGGNLDEIREKFCRDAIEVTREESGARSVQVGSFTTEARATEFAKIVGGEIGKPNVLTSSKSNPHNEVEMNVDPPRLVTFEAGSLAKFLKFTEKYREKEILLKDVYINGDLERHNRHFFTVQVYDRDPITKELIIESGTSHYCVSQSMIFLVTELMAGMLIDDLKPSKNYVSNIYLSGIYSNSSCSGGFVKKIEMISINGKVAKTYDIF